MPAYKEAIHWVAQNDEPEETDLNVVSDWLTVMLIADLWGRTPMQVALDVVTERVRLLSP